MSLQISGAAKIGQKLPKIKSMVSEHDGSGRLAVPIALFERCEEVLKLSGGELKNCTLPALPQVQTIISGVKPGRDSEVNLAVAT